ncbi:MAG: sugar ABC transporter permease [Clostridia bacterium]|jgi:putative multiple sugar transport system permease protein|nr:sugar ABC transporter permease [Clostridia bacterium]
MSLLKEAKQLIKENIREYGMYIALVVIMVIFSVATGGVFTSSRNISNLINQNGYVAVLTVGMTLILIICNIDLSVGFVAGFLGAVAAILLTKYSLPVFIVIPIVLILGIVIGLWNGLLVGRLKIPAFVVTLAGMMIFRGALLLITGKSGTIIVPNKTFNAIGNGFIPDIVKDSDIHILTLIIGGLVILYYIWSQFKTRQTNIKYKFQVLSMPLFIFKLLFISAIIGYLTWVLANYNGFSWTTVVVAIVVGIYHFITNKTQLGRHIYAVGGNIEAAKLSGINVRKITYIVFASMSMLAALSGILFTARLQSASVVAGTGFEMDAIAAAYVGGVSAAGGVGKVTGSIIGAFVIASLTNGMNLLGVGIHYQYIIKGLVLVAAVAFDIQTRKKRK